MVKKKEEPKIEVVEKPHHSFCKNCNNIDNRILKDTLNMVVMTINLLVEELGVDSTSIESKCKKLRTWALEQRTKRIRREGVKKDSTKVPKKRYRTNKTKP